MARACGRRLFYGPRWSLWAPKSDRLRGQSQLWRAAVIAALNIALHGDVDAQVISGVLRSALAATGCVGDCNADGEVTIDELLVGVNIALGVQPLADCPAFDGHGDGNVTIDVLLAAVNNALHDCPMGAATPTPSPSATPTGGDAAAASVLQHHRSGDRRGVSVMPELTEAAAASLVLDTTFTPRVDGNVYAQPLYVADAGGHDRVFVATESNQVSAFFAADGSIAWQRTLAPPMDGTFLPCGNINPLGITGTPIIDLPSRTLFLDAMTDTGGHTAAHQIYALSIDDGSTRPGWPVDANSAIANAGTTFDSTVQNQRPALTILNGKIYVAYGGLSGDCGTYYGWLVGIDMDNPTAITTWKSPLIGTALWGMSGPATDGQFLYMTTGNSTEPPSHTWQGTEAILRWNPGPTFSGNPSDYFAPANFYELDSSDLDLGGTAPILVDLKGPPAASSLANERLLLSGETLVTAQDSDPTGSGRTEPTVQGPALLVVALGKDGTLYLADRNNLGGVGGQLFQLHVANDAIINAAASYTTAQGTYVVFKAMGGIGCPGPAGDLVAVRLGLRPASLLWTAPVSRYAVPSPELASRATSSSLQAVGAEVAWCANQHGGGSPMVTQTRVDGGDTIVWGLGTESAREGPGDSRLHGFDGDTGALVYAGGGAAEQMGPLHRFITPIVASGRIFVAGDDHVYAFKVP